MKKYRYFITYSYTGTGSRKTLYGSCMVDMKSKIESNYDLNTVYNKLVKRDELVSAFEDIVHCGLSELSSYSWSKRKFFLDLTILSFKLIKVK